MDWVPIGGVRIARVNATLALFACQWLWTTKSGFGKHAWSTSDMTIGSLVRTLSHVFVATWNMDLVSSQRKLGDK